MGVPLHTAPSNVLAERREFTSVLLQPVCSALILRFLLVYRRTLLSLLRLQDTISDESVYGRFIFREPRPQRDLRNILEIPR
jgi:hypothetical protein